MSITCEMSIADIVALCPESEAVLAEYGLHCVNCAANGLESLEEGCLGHGFTTEDVHALVDDLNDLMKETDAHPRDLTVTASAARAIRDIAEAEGKTGQGLAVTLDGAGSFCLEFQPEPKENERTYNNKEEPDVRIFVSTLTLRRVGGGTIDMRDGRFKLDLPEAVKKACACGGNCSCKK